ncbi:MAG: caspase family protein [Alphaproteobacteria bacterium]|nr:caspase family protein [Alphaproteobacteria bacterium]MCB9758219.1 caspase family protein [Alphaproteobacteria bacterium]MCB9793019.1 caspase family protein [Alphaproteobacteria bacterium]
MSLATLALLGALGPAWADTARIGLFVGNNVGFGQDEPLSWAEKEARDMARVFQEMGDFDRERVYVLEGPSAVQLRETIQQVEAQVREAAADGDEVMLVFYYSGHGSSQGLHLSGTLYPMDQLRRWLEGSEADVRVAFVDACESGTLARARGGQAVEALEITVDDALTMSGLAVIASTGPLSVAREDDSFGGGVFSRALLNGLRGSADTDNDGVITLDEAYRYAFAETVVGTAAQTLSVQTPEYRYDLEGVGSVVLTRIPARAAGLVLPEELEGVYTVVSVADGQVVARVDKQPGQVERLALPPGRYVVRKMRTDDVLLAELDLVWGGDRWLEDSQMSQLDLGDPLARGGWHLRPYRLGLRGAALSPMLPGLRPSVGAELDLRALLRPNLGVSGFVAGQRNLYMGQHGDAHTWVGRVGAGLAYERHLSRVDLLVAGGPELAALRQVLRYEQVESEDHHQTSLSLSQLTGGAWAGLGLHVPVGPTVGLELGSRGHLLYANVAEESVSGLRLVGEVGGYVGVAASLGGRGLARASRE